MKENIKVLIIGFLIGAIITSGVCYFYIKSNLDNCNNQSMQMMGGTPPQMPSGQNGQPPEKPNGENPKEMQNEAQNNN